MILKKLNESYSIIEGEKEELEKIADFLKVEKPNAHFDRLIKLGFKSKYHYFTSLQDDKLIIYNGHVFLLKDFEPQKETTNISDKEIEDFIESVNLPFKPYDYQIRNIKLALQNKKMLFKSATSSGKSLSISLILEFFRRTKKRGILIVPNINLLTQFKSDIDSYGLKELSEETLLLGNGHESDFSTCLTITTWQSLMKHMDNLNFDFIICDECLHPDTLITTKSGSKYIKDVKTGDLVLSYNEATNEYEYKDVVEVHKNLASSRNEKIYDIELENGKIITITGNHTVFTKRGWIRADNLTLEDDILEIPNEL